MYLPYDLMTERFSLYRATITKVQGAYSDATDTLVTADIPCMLQRASKQVIEDYGKLEQKVTHSIYTLDATAYESVSPHDRLVVAGVDYWFVAGSSIGGKILRLDVESRKVKR